MAADREDRPAPIEASDDVDLEGVSEIEPTLGERLRNRFLGADAAAAGDDEPRSPLHDAVAAASAEALAKHDPTGLMEIGGTSEDFDNEADDIAGRALTEAQSADDLQAIVREVLDDHHGPEERAEVPAIADAIWLAFEAARTEAEQDDG